MSMAIVLSGPAMEQRRPTLGFDPRRALLCRPPRRPLKALHRDRAARSPLAPDPLVVRAAPAAAPQLPPLLVLPLGASARSPAAHPLLPSLIPAQDVVADRLLDRLEDCRRSFERAVILGGAGAKVAERLAGGRAGIQVRASAEAAAGRQGVPAAGRRYP